jgi:hypothetical protein
MIHLLLAACLLPPLFDMSGPPCADPLIECGCSECMTWDETPTATRYEIIRTDPGGLEAIVGTSSIYGGYADDDGAFWPLNPQELWCFAKDSSLPAEGMTYRYKVRACNATAVPQCGPSSAQVTYVAAPYRVYP